MEKYFPTSVLITGFDIIFFWVARMMMMQYAVVDQKPFETVYVHALVRDEKGKKMSKSLGNVLDPLDLIDDYGADAVRFTLTAMAAMGRDLKLSTARIDGYRKFGNKIWNATAFAERNGVLEVPHSDTPPDTTLTVNKWIKGEIAKTREAVDAALAQYRFNDAANTLYAFVWGTFCDWYLEFTKPIFDGDDAAAITETRATYGWALDQCLILLHPIMPFITEELWGQKDRPGMLVHAEWPTYTAAEMVDAQADEELNWVISLIQNIRSARVSMGVPGSLKVPMVYTEIDAAGLLAWERNQDLIARRADVEKLEKVEVFPKGTASIPARAATLVEQPQIRRLRPRRGCRRGAGQSGCAAGRSRSASGRPGPVGGNGLTPSFIVPANTHTRAIALARVSCFRCRGYLKTAGRFPNSAATTSIWCGLPSSSACSRDSASRTAASPATSASEIKRLAARMAEGLLPAMTSASAVAAASGSSATSVTSPQHSACAVPIGSAV